jgi:hypothetical protein
MPQGASAGAVRYSWFVDLELLSRERFAAPAHVRKYFIVDPEPSRESYQLPVGFTHHFDPAIGERTDISCAACHRASPSRRMVTRAPFASMGASRTCLHRQPGNFAPVLLGRSWTRGPTHGNSIASRRMCSAPRPRARPRLRKALRATITAMLGAGQNNPLRGLYPVHEGFGRTDALGRIGNTAFGDHLSKSNYQIGDAPVSYPYLWNIWKFDWVQYNGSVAQPLARNVGEALGVGAVTPLQDAAGAPLPPWARYRSSVDIAGLVRVEHALQMLRPPAWPEDILGAIDHARPRAVRHSSCGIARMSRSVAEAARRRATAPLKPSNDLSWRISDQLEHIGTDPNAPPGFIGRRYDLSATGLSNQDLQQALRPLLTRCCCATCVSACAKWCGARRAGVPLGDRRRCSRLSGPDAEHAGGAARVLLRPMLTCRLLPAPSVPGAAARRRMCTTADSNVTARSCCGTCAGSNPSSQAGGARRQQARSWR